MTRLVYSFKMQNFTSSGFTLDDIVRVVNLLNNNNVQTAVSTQSDVSFYKLSSQVCLINYN